MEVENPDVHGAIIVGFAIVAVIIIYLTGGGN